MPACVGMFGFSAIRVNVDDLCRKRPVRPCLVVNFSSIGDNEAMIHKILPVGPLQCNCSIIGDETTHEAMVIDPGDDIDDIVAIIASTNSR